MPKKNWAQKNFWVQIKKNGFQIFKENVWVRIFVLKNFGSAFFFEKMFGPKKSFSSKQILGLKKFLGLKKISGLKKCTLHKYFLAENIFGPKKFWIKKMLEKYFGSKKSPIKCDPKNLGPKSLVKIVSLTAEIFRIWTKFTLTVGIR